MTQRTRPVLVHNVSNAVSIGSGRDHGVAVLADGTVRTWGYNVNGQLGDGTTTSRTSAVAVPGVTGAEKAGGGGAEYSVVLVGSGPPQPSPPTARITPSCDQLACTFDGSGSTDDGTITSYAWADRRHRRPDAPTRCSTTRSTGGDPHRHADGHRQRRADRHHEQPGDGQRHPAATVVTFDGVRTFNGNVAKPTVAVPAGDRPGIGGALRHPNRAATATTPAGWTLRPPFSDGNRGPGSSPGRRPRRAGPVTVTLDAISKVNLTVLAYDGAGRRPPPEQREPGTTTQHKTPNASVATAGSTVVSYWADRPRRAHGWTLPARRHLPVDRR